MPAKVETTAALPGLSPVGGKPVIARFDGGHLSSDGGLLVLREVERRLDVAGRLAACIKDPRDPERVVHGLDEIIRFRLLMIAAGYEDGNDADQLRTDPMFKLAMAKLGDGAALCSQPTISRLENLPGTRALLRMGRAMVDLYCASFRQVPRRIVLDVDDTFDTVHGGQQMRLFNAHHDEYGFQPIVVFDGEGRFVTAVLRPAKRPSGREVRAFLRRLLRQLRANWPRVEVLLRADSHYCGPEVLRWCRANTVDYLIGVAPTSTLRRHVECLEASTAARFAASDGSDARASSAASPSSTTVPQAGTAWSASSPASRPGRTGQTRASSSPACRAARPALSTKNGIARADRRKTTSRAGNATWPPTALRAPRPPPTSSACSCMGPPTGSCGACAR